MAEWKPEGCPIARDQTHGYKHLHGDWCGASPEQLAEDAIYLAFRKNVRRRRIEQAAMTMLGAIICMMLALAIAMLVILGEPWMLLSMIAGGLIGLGVVWIGRKVLVRRK